MQFLRVGDNLPGVTCFCVRYVMSKAMIYIAIVLFLQIRFACSCTNLARLVYIEFDLFCTYCGQFVNLDWV